MIAPRNEELAIEDQRQQAIESAQQRAFSTYTHTMDVIVRAFDRSGDGSPEARENLEMFVKSVVGVGFREGVKFERARRENEQEGDTDGTND